MHDWISQNFDSNKIDERLSDYKSLGWDVIAQTCRKKISTFASTTLHLRFEHRFSTNNYNPSHFWIMHSSKNYEICMITMKDSEFNLNLAWVYQELKTVRVNFLCFIYGDIWLFCLLKRFLKNGLSEKIFCKKIFEKNHFGRQNSYQTN